MIELTNTGVRGRGRNRRGAGEPDLGLGDTEEEMRVVHKADELQNGTGLNWKTNYCDRTTRGSCDDFWRNVNCKKCLAKRKRAEQ